MRVWSGGKDNQKWGWRESTEQDVVTCTPPVGVFATRIKWNQAIKMIKVVHRLALFPGSLLKPEERREPGDEASAPVTSKLKKINGSRSCQFYH